MSKPEDIKLIETQDGGDYELLGADVASYRGWQNMVYLALFGGNVEQSTTTQGRNFGEQYFDWWGNSLEENPAVWMNSQTERRLKDTELSSFGIRKIRAAVQSDLSFMQPFANITLNVGIEGWNRLSIDIFVQEKENLEEAQFRFIWDQAEEDVFAIDQDATVTTIGDFDGNDYDLQDFY